MDGRILIDEKLRTKRLVLRSRIFDDNAFVFEATRYPGFNDGMPWNPPETIEEMYERYHMTLANWIKGSNYSFIMVDRELEQRVGIISIRKTDVEEVWDIGYWTHPAVQGRGYMKEAARAVLDFGFQRLKAESIVAQYALWNIASERVLKALGMEFVEYLEKGFEKNGEWVKENKMGISKAAWMSLRTLPPS